MYWIWPERPRLNAMASPFFFKIGRISWSCCRQNQCKHRQPDRDQTWFFVFEVPNVFIPEKSNIIQPQMILGINQDAGNITNWLQWPWVPMRNIALGSSKTTARTAWPRMSGRYRCIIMYYNAWRLANTSKANLQHRMQVFLQDTGKEQHQHSTCPPSRHSAERQK